MKLTHTVVVFTIAAGLGFCLTEAADAGSKHGPVGVYGVTKSGPDSRRTGPRRNAKLPKDLRCERGLLRRNQVQHQSQRSHLRT